MPPLDIEKFRQMLLHEKKRLESDKAWLNGGLSADSGELADFDINHPGDTGTEMFEREKDLALNENVEDLLEQVNTALVKVENGTYGLCDHCGKPIAEGRLEALPYATFCIVCQSRMEGR
jgi:RNA polymerase-binding protein DksA